MSVPASFASTPVTLDGVTKTVQEWCDERRLSPDTVYQRRVRCCNWAEALAPAKRGGGLRARLDMEYIVNREKARI